MYHASWDIEGALSWLFVASREAACETRAKS
jgi:hypothetical protein